MTPPPTPAILGDTQETDPTELLVEQLALSLQTPLGLVYWRAVRPSWGLRNLVKFNPPPRPGSYSSPCGSKYSRDGPVTRNPPSQLTKRSSCTRQSSNSRKQDISSTRRCNKWAAGLPPNSTGRGAKNGKRNSMLHRWQSHIRCWSTSTGRRDRKSSTRTAHPRTIPRWGGLGATGCTSETHGTPQRIFPVRNGRQTIEVSLGRRCMRFKIGISPSRH